MICDETLYHPAIIFSNHTFLYRVPTPLCNPPISHHIAISNKHCCQSIWKLVFKFLFHCLILALQFKSKDPRDCQRCSSVGREQACPVCIELQVPSTALHKWNVITHTHNPSTWEMKDQKFKVIFTAEYLRYMHTPQHRTFENYLHLR